MQVLLINIKIVILLKEFDCLLIILLACHNVNMS